MSSLEAEIDASFYNLIHQLSTAAGNSIGNRRLQPRSRFVTTQRIALRASPGIPDESDFIEVLCHDLNQGGFSFLLPDAPTFQFLVVAFGAPPSVIHLSARVTHSEPVLVHASGLIERFREESGGLPEAPSVSAQHMVLIGCTFIERLTASPPSLTVVE